ncbi:MAG: hypothetical protein KJ011_02325 [Burkholderiaceae bacterium]|nr:hypothetical protein [Burkholderiaceae bacterium]
MAILLETLAADGTLLLRTPLVIGVTLVQAQPGQTYRVVNDFGGRVAHSALIKRVGDDLRVELPQDRNISLEGFFTRCTPEAGCSLSMENIGGTAGEAVTPATVPVAELPDGGGVLMYASGAAVAPPTAAAESGFSFKPVVALVGGLAIAAGAGGGGGGNGGDSTPPDAPQLTSSALTRLAQPAFTGTAEAGAQVTLTLFGTNPVTYETTAGTDGAWQIDTATATPRAGTPIMLAEGMPVPLSVIATDAAGNPSAITSGSVMLDSIALAAPIITSPLVTSDPTPVIRGTAEAGSQVSVALDVDRNGSIEATWITTASASGTWSVDLGTAPASGTLPGGQLADDSVTRLVLTASDGVNTSAPGIAELRVDTSLARAPTIAAVTGDDAVNLIEAGAGVTISGTLPEAGRPVSVTWGAVTLPATVNGNDWSVTFSAAQVPAGGSVAVRASYVSAGGATSDEATRDVLVDRTAPLAPAIVAVPENGNGGISASEAANGTPVQVSLAGTGAVAGDRIVLQWDGLAVATRAITGTEIGGGVATVTVPAATLTGSADGNHVVTARVVDVAGNEGATSTGFQVLLLDRSPDYTLTDARIVDNVGLFRGTVRDGGITDDTRPELRLTLNSVLASGDSLEIYRATGSGSPVLVREFGQRDDDFSYTDGPLARGNTYTYTAQVVDAAGNVTPLSLDYSIILL